MRALPAFFVATVALVFGASGCPRDEVRDPTESCRTWMSCFFPENSETPYKELGPDGDGYVNAEGEIRAAYAEGGQCWTTDDETAEECDARCKDELSTECGRRAQGGGVSCETDLGCPEPP